MKAKLTRYQIDEACRMASERVSKMTRKEKDDLLKRAREIIDAGRTPESYRNPKGSAGCGGEV